MRCSSSRNTMSAENAPVPQKRWRTCWATSPAGWTRSSKRTKKASEARQPPLERSMTLSSRTQMQEVVNPQTGMTHSEMKEFVRNHFEEFVNRKNLNIGKINFAPEFLAHDADVHPGPSP